MADSEKPQEGEKTEEEKFKGRLVPKPKKKVEVEAEVEETPVDKKREAVLKAASQVEKRFGKGSVMDMGTTGALVKVDTFPSGSLTLDKALGVGGYPRGRILEIYGLESCLDGDTFIQYSIRMNGRIINSKGGSIRRLWERFNGEPSSGNGQGKYLRPSSIGAEFYAPSINEEDRIFQHRIIDVVKTGTQQCFRLTTLSGQSIVSSKDHRFFTGTEWIELEYLSPGDQVMVHLNTPFTKEYATYGKRRTYCFVKHHPVAGIKIITSRISRTEEVYREYPYHRLGYARAIIEAHLSGLSISDYLDRLNQEEPDFTGLQFLQRDDHVHHIDEDEGNNELSNLLVIKALEHGRLHALQRHNNLRFVATEDFVESIEPVGDRETFDLKMDIPFNNYIANRFVTHNSGKTTLALHAIAECQKLGEHAYYIDAEHALDPAYAQCLGVNLSKLMLSQPDYGEQALEIADMVIRSEGFGLVVIDSVAALVPRAELDGDMGDSHMGLQARLMGQAMRKIAGIASTTRTAVIFINQIREKIGVIFGSNQTTSGGNALKFYSTIRMEIKKIGLIKEGETVVGNRTKVKVVKNKVAPPFQEAEFDIIWGKGIVKIRELFDVAVEYGVLDKKGSHYSFGEEKLDQGRTKVLLMLENNSELLSKVEAMTRDKMLNGGVKALTAGDGDSEIEEE